MALFSSVDMISPSDYVFLL